MDELMNPIVEDVGLTPERPEASCRCVFTQEEKVTVPVKVEPFAKPCEAKVTCCGRPVIVCCNQHDKDKGCCNFTVTQTLRMEIPISFGAMVETGDVVVECRMAETEDCDCK